MKRVFAYIGISMAVTLILLNLFVIKNFIIVLIGLAVIFTASLVLPYFRQAKVVPVSVGAALFACLLFCINYYNVFLPQMELADKTINSTFYVIEATKFDDEYYTYVAKTTEIKRVGMPQNIKIVFDSTDYIEPYKELNGQLCFYSVADNGFHSYGNYADKIYLGANLESFVETGNSIKSVSKYVNDLRNSISSLMNNYVKDQEGAFSNAILTGDKSLLTDDTKDYFTNSGTSHIMAVSGLHLTFIIGGFALLFRLIKLKKQYADLLSIAITLMYMSLASFSGSIKRAGVMMIVMLIGDIINKRSDSLNTLGVAVAILCVNPYSVTDIGFLYSVVSVLAILTIYPLLSRKLVVIYKDPLFKTKSEKAQDKISKVFSVALVSIAVSLCTFPISYLFFGRTSITGPVANIIVVPFTEISIVLSFLTYLLTFTKISFLINIFAGITKFINCFTISVAKYFSSFRGSVLTFDKSTGIIIALVLIIIAFGFFLHSKRSIIVALSLALFFLVVGSIFVGMYNKNDAKICVVDSGGVIVTYKDKTIIYDISSNDGYIQAKNYLSTIRDDVDFLVVNDESFYSNLLTYKVEVNNLITSEFDDIILADSRYKHIEVQNTYNVRFGDDVKIYYDNGDISIDVNGFVISTNNSRANLFVTEEFAYDTNGKIALNDGAVVYTVSNQNTFTVRRINQWQK